MAPREDSPLSPAALARQYFGGLAHVHTKLSNHPGHHESDLSVSSLLRTLAGPGKLTPGETPLGFILINEHSSNPNRPSPLGRLSLRGRRLLRQRRRPSVSGVPMLYGLEVSMLPDGQTDLTPRLADNCALVIASRHRLPSETEHDPKHIMALFESMCRNDKIDVLGHPLRYIDAVAGVDWKAVFELAAQTNTAVEANLNTFPEPGAAAEQRHFWKRWLRLLAQSGAPVFIGTDLHTRAQADNFVTEWERLSDINVPSKLASFVLALAEAGIGPDRVITASREKLENWIATNKAKRG